MLDLKDTYALMQAAERIKTPASFLLDTFFPVKPAVATTTHIIVEYRKKGRKLAPFITPGSGGVNMNLEGSKVDVYTPPMMGPAVTITPEMIDVRSFGETVYSTMTPMERANQLQAQAMVELQDMIVNRKNKMAADILTTGQCVIEGYSDDVGKKKVLDTVKFDWEQKITPGTAWTQAGATIYDDIRNASLLIQENAGMVPSVMVVGKNVFRYLIDNDEIAKILAVPNRDNLAMFNLQPTITSPQVMYGGKIASLGIDIYTYAETYTAEDGTVKPFIPDDGVILAVPGRGRQLHSAVTLLDETRKGFNTYVGTYVPYLKGDDNAQQLKLTMYSRCVLAPEFADDWAYINAKGE